MNTSKMGYLLYFPPKKKNQKLSILIGKNEPIMAKVPLNFEVINKLVKMYKGKG